MPFKLDTIYADANAGASIAPAVAAKLRSLNTDWHNASSVHSQGQATRALLEHARDDIADNMAIPSDTLVFTSGGTESVCTALWSLSAAPATKIFLEQAAHPASRAFAKLLAEQKLVTVHEIPIDKFAAPKAIASQLEGSNIVFHLQAAHSETGVCLDVAYLTKLRHSYPNARIHVDACQALAKTKFAHYLPHIVFRGIKLVRFRVLDCCI